MITFSIHPSTVRPVLWIALGFAVLLLASCQ